MFTSNARLAAGAVKIDVPSALQILKFAPAVTSARHNCP